jgi:SAM-dependent methyltransferase
MSSGGPSPSDQPRIAKRQCPVCGWQSVDLLRRFDLVVPAGHLLDEQIDVVVCRRCGVGYNDSARSQAEYDRYYADASKYDDPGTTTGAGVADWDRKRLEEAVQFIAARFPRTARVIDLGCATGGLLRCFQDAGFVDLVGIDPSDRCIGITRELKVEAHRGSIFELPAISPGDVCIVYAVMEHIRDVRAAVVGCRQLLRDGGCLYVVVPDAARYAQYAPSPFQDFNTEHINHFSVTTLDRAVCECGFETVECTPFDIPTNAGVSAAIGGLWRRTDRREERAFARDHHLCAALSRYVDISERRMREIGEWLQYEIDPGEPHMVWGTGQLLYKMLGISPLKDLEIGAFVDSNPVNQGKRLRGVPVLSPQQAASRTEPIIVASVLAFESIERRIRHELGMTNRLVRLTRPPAGTA